MFAIDACLQDNISKDMAYNNCLTFQIKQAPAEEFYCSFEKKLPRTTREAMSKTPA